MISGDLQSLKLANTKALIAALSLSSEPLSIATLAQKTTLSRTTVEGILANLSHAGILQERLGQVSAKGGRPPRFFELDYNAGLVSGIIFNQDEIIITVANLAGKILFSKTTPITPADNRPHLSISILSQSLRLLERDMSDLRVVTVSIIGETTPTGRKLQKTHFPDLSDTDFFEKFSALFPCPVLFHNDADLSAMAEYQEIPIEKKPKVLVAVTVSWAFGGGVIINGELFTGANKGAAEMGHDKYLSWPDAFTQLAEFRKKQNLTIRGFYTAALNGDAEALAAFKDFIRRGMPGIRALICAFDPDLLIVSGLASLLPEPLLEIVEADLAEHLPVYPSIVCSPLQGLSLEKGTIQSCCKYLQQTSFGLL